MFNFIVQYNDFKSWDYKTQVYQQKIFKIQ